MTHSEVFSPVGLLRVLKLVNRKKPLRIIQLRNHNFLEFQRPAKLLRFNQIPYSQVREIQYQKDSTAVNYKLFGSDDNVNVNVVREIGARKPKKYKADSKFPRVNVSSVKTEITAAKKADIKAMLKFMPEVDKTHYKNLFDNH